MTREEAFKENPALAKETDFITQHERKLKELHKQFMIDEGVDIPFIEFADYIYNHAQGLVFNPSEN